MTARVSDVVIVGLRRHLANALVLHVKAETYRRRVQQPCAGEAFGALAETARQTVCGCLSHIRRLTLSSVPECDNEFLALSAGAFFPSDRLEAMLEESRGDLDRIVAQLHGDERRVAQADPQTCELYRDIRRRYEAARETLVARTCDAES